MTSKNLREPGSTTHARPTSTAEKEAFSSGGNRHLIILRGKAGLAIDTSILWLTGYSLMTKQYTEWFALSVDAPAVYDRCEEWQEAPLRFALLHGGRKLHRARKQWRRPH